MIFNYLHIPEGFMYKCTKVPQAAFENNIFPSFIASTDEKGCFQMSIPAVSSKLQLKTFSNWFFLLCQPSLYVANTAFLSKP